MLEDKLFVVSELIEDFRVHLQTTCGVCNGTSLRYTTRAREFLEWKAGDEVHLAAICPADLIAFVSEYAFKHKPKTSKLAASALRSFLKFLQLKGHCGAQLVASVPTVPAWKLSSVPTCLSASQVELLLSVFDRTTRNGQRGYAMAQCMMGLGLRAGEVAQLSLDDIDWRTGVIGISKTKARRAEKLPLPPVVGEAIAEYLRKGRPPTSNRHVFVCHAGPLGKTLTSSAVSRITHRAMIRSGVNVASKGSHVLRHTAAARMVQAGASLKAISDVLRHRHIDTTMIYAKVDLPGLREVAMPWPEVKA